jgi:hypothetical protein
MLSNVMRGGKYTFALENNALTHRINVKPNLLYDSDCQTSADNESTKRRSGRNGVWRRAPG